MAELLPCPFCGNPAYDHISYHIHAQKQRHIVKCTKCNASMEYRDKKSAINAWNTRTPKESEADKPKITCLNCKHLMFSDMYGECNKQLRIVNPSDTCEYAEPKERGGEK